MTAAKFEQIKSSIESAKKKRDMAEGARQKIEESWLKEFDISSPEEVENKLLELEKEIDKDKATREKLMNKLENCAGEEME